MLRGVRQQQDELERFSICSRQAAVVLPESEPFEQEVIVDVVFPGNTGNRGPWL